MLNRIFAEYIYVISYPALLMKSIKKKAGKNPARFIIQLLAA